MSPVYLLLQDAVEYEDKHSLQRVEDGEEISHDHRALVDIHEPERPGQSQQTQQSNGTYNPGSEKDRRAHNTHFY